MYRNDSGTLWGGLALQNFFTAPEPSQKLVMRITSSESLVKTCQDFISGADSMWSPGLSRSAQIQV